jgi:hypothetical protein
VVAGIAWSVRAGRYGVQAPVGGWYFTELPRPYLRPTLPLVQWVLRFLGVQRPWRGAVPPPLSIEYARSCTSTFPLYLLSCKGTAYPFLCKVVEFLSAKTLSLGRWSAVCLFCNREIVNQCIWITGGTIVDTWSWNARNLTCSNATLSTTEPT